MIKILSISTFLLLQLNAQNINLATDKWKSIGSWVTSKENNSTIVSLTKPSGEYYNLYFTKDVNLSNGTLSVMFKANSGSEDQGGGIMWNVQDENNYLVARFNPLEDNFRFYTVTDGLRVEKASSSIKLASGWHSMTIKVYMSHYRLFLDNKKLLDFSYKSKFKKLGGIGLWTKSDALSSFKSFEVGYWK